MANNIIKLIVAGAQVLGRAFTRAVRSEFAASQQAANKAGGGAEGAKSAATTGFHGMTLEEAQKILNVDNIKDAEVVKKTFDHLMKVNDRSQKGSFYVQSKVFRAKERIDAEISTQGAEQKSENTEKKSEEK